MAGSERGRRIAQGISRAKADTAAISGAIGGPLYLRLAIPAALIIGGVILFRRLRKTSADRQQEEIENAYRNAAVYDKEVTITQAQANIYAKRLLAAMDRKGTDEAAIFSILNALRTHSDLLLVQKAFGAPFYMFTGSSNSWITKTIGMSRPLDLNGWLRAELSGNALEQVLQIYQRLGEQL